MGSGVVMHLSILGGEDVIEPVCIRDGLSKETIDAIKADLKRSYDLATLLKL
jgi:disulfide oxidoreductase YuzD